MIYVVLFEKKLQTFSGFHSVLFLMKNRLRHQLWIAKIILALILRDQLKLLLGLGIFFLPICTLVQCTPKSNLGVVKL